MDVIVITGAPGVGKTALLPALADRLPEKSAFVDGDSVGRTRPLCRTLERLNLIQDNIVACAHNFATWGARYVVAAFVFPSQERVERIAGTLRDAGHRVWVVALVADDDVLLERFGGKDWYAGELDDPEYAAHLLDLNSAVKQLGGVICIDTSSLSVEDAATTILDRIGIEQRAPRR